MNGEQDGEYSAILDIEMDKSAGKWKYFCVQLEGNTTGTHLVLVDKIKSIGHIQVSSHEESDYQLVFCPIVSRTGTDIGEALENIPDGKEAVLVVMHHTCNTNGVLVSSRRLVNLPNVRCSVDVLFYDGKYLSCETNSIAWGELCRFFGVTPLQKVVADLVVVKRIYKKWLRPRLSPGWICGALIVVGIIAITVYFSGYKLWHKNDL